MRRIYIKKGISAILTLCAVLGWWGAIYPHFTLLRGTCRIVCEDASATGRETEADSDKTEMNSTELYWEILDADSSHIRWKSRLLEDWKALQGAEERENESGNQY